jgi:hypothetical protein
MKYLVQSQWPRGLNAASERSGGRFCFRHIMDVWAFFFPAHHSSGQSVMG